MVWLKCEEDVRRPGQYLPTYIQSAASNTHAPRNAFGDDSSTSTEKTRRHAVVSKLEAVTIPDCTALWSWRAVKGEGTKICHQRSTTPQRLVGADFWLLTAIGMESRWLCGADELQQFQGPAPPVGAQSPL